MRPSQSPPLPAEQEISPFSREQFVRSQTVLAAPPLVPEIALHVAREPYKIWQSTMAFAATLPFWSFAWPGGQALARYLLDHPEIVAGRSVLDLGCGSAIAGIAAMKAGAASCIAADIDTLALTAAGLNAKSASVTMDETARDLLSSKPAGWNVVLVGDVAYEPLLADRIEHFLFAAAEAGAKVLFGDRTTSASRLARGPGIAEYEAGVFPVLEDECVERARIWQVECDG